MSQKYRDFKNEFAVAAHNAIVKQNWEYVQKPDTVSIWWNIWTMRGDIDAYFKPAMDALNGLVYEDDSQVKEFTRVILRRGSPRIIMEIRRL